jgi:hypothetical protein
MDDQHQVRLVSTSPQLLVKIMDDQHQVRLVSTSPQPLVKVTFFWLGPLVITSPNFWSKIMDDWHQVRPVATWPQLLVKIMNDHRQVRPVATSPHFFVKVLFFLVGSTSPHFAPTFGQNYGWPTSGQTSYHLTPNFWSKLWMTNIRSDQLPLDPQLLVKIMDDQHQVRPVTTWPPTFDQSHIFLVETTCHHFAQLLVKNYGWGSSSQTSRHLASNFWSKLWMRIIRSD